jgi:hypothetical protein
LIILTAVFGPPIYFNAPSVNPKIIGEFVSLTTSRIALAHSKLFTFICAIA